MSKILIINILIAISLSISAAPADLLQKAAEIAQKANQTVQDDSDQAKQLWKEASDLYEEALSKGLAPSGELYFNLGNAYAQQDDLPRAIINYRRAQFFLLRNRSLRANLQYVRAKRQDHFPQPETSPTLQALLFWHYDLAFHTRLWLTIALAAAAWLCAILLLWWRPAWLKTLAILLLVCTLAFGVSVAANVISLRCAHPAVIVADEVIPKKGAGASYDNAFDAPIHAGTEVLVLRDRDEWCKIELPTPDRLTAWLPAEDLEKL